MPLVYRTIDGQQEWLRKASRKSNRWEFEWTVNRNKAAPVDDDTASAVINYCTNQSTRDRMPGGAYGVAVSAQ